MADNINGPYSSWKVMDGTDEDFSYVTQTGFFVTVKGTKQETVLYCGDRWSDFAGNGIGYNQWVPFTVNGNDIKFNSLSEWDFNATTGEWSVGAGNNYCLNPTFEAYRVSQTTLDGITVTDGKVQIGIYSDANAGNWLMVDDFTLKRSDAPSEPITVEPEKIPDGKYIKSLTVNDSDNSSDWSIQTGIDSGKEVFGDNAEIVNPPELHQEAVSKGADFFLRRYIHKRQTVAYRTFVSMLTGGGIVWITITVKQ